MFNKETMSAIRTRVEEGPQDYDTFNDYVLPDVLEELERLWKIEEAAEWHKEVFDTAEWIVWGQPGRVLLSSETRQAYQKIVAASRLALFDALPQEEPKDA